MRMQVLEQAFPLGRQLAIVVIGDAQQVRERLERYGPVQQIALAAGSFTQRKRRALEQGAPIRELPSSLIAVFSWLA